MGNWHVNRIQYYMSLLGSVHVTCAKSSNCIQKCQNYSPQCLRTKTEMLKWKLRTILVSFLMWKELSVTRLFLLNKVNPAVYFKVFGCLHQWIFENNQIGDWKSEMHIITYIPTPHFLAQQLWPNAYAMLEHHCPDLAHFWTLLLSLKGVSLWIPLYSVQCGNITESLYTVFQHCSQARQKRVWSL